MESQITAQVMGVSGRMSRDGQHQMYDVKMSDGLTYTTFEPSVAQQAAALQGQQAVANVEVKPGRNGKMYTNLNAIGQPGTLAAPAPSAAAPNNTFPVAPSTTFPVAGVSIPNAPSSYDESEPRIARSAAAKVAFELVGSLFQGAGPEALPEALGLARQVTEAVLGYTQGGMWPGGLTVTPAEVAAAVPGVQQGVQGIEQPAAPAPGNDIPWD